MLHNHYWEFSIVDGRLVYDWFAELCPDVLFELDTYWAANFGANNPAVEVAKFKARIPYLHIKDGNLEHNQPMLAVGQGKMDFPAIVAAADTNVLRWNSSSWMRAPPICSPRWKRVISTWWAISWQAGRGS